MEISAKQPSPAHRDRLRATPASFNWRQAATLRICCASRRAFSLLELLIVIAVAMLLTSLLMPAMQHVRENAHRIICMSHLNQIGQALIIYTAENNEWLPYSAVLHIDHQPSNLQTAKRGGIHGTWDGLGLLFALGYCPTPECFYCPSHHGNHPFEAYADLWQHPYPNVPIYTNYHYAGDSDWNNLNIRRKIDDGSSLALASDGLRSVGDFNHFDGMNVLRADGSVYWRDESEDILHALPATDSAPPSTQYPQIWDMLLNHH